MLLSPLRYINPISGNRGVSAAFSIAKSFYFDGVDEYMTTPTSQLDPNIFGGTNNKYTINVNLFIVSPSASQYIFSGLEGGANSFILYLTNLQVTLVTNNNAKTLRTSTNLNYGWNTFSVSVDLETPSNSKITVNGSVGVISINNLTSTTAVAAGNYWIGARNNLTNYFNGYISSISVVNRVTTLSEDISWHNNGKPKDAQALFGTDCKWFFNPDNSGDTAQFSVVDSVNSITATSVNMEDDSKTTETPY